MYPDATIEQNVKISGKLSRTSREIDIAIRQKLGPQNLLIIVECKCWNRKIDVETIEAFASKREDVGANIAMMISSKGFSKSADNFAAEKQISLYTLEDTLTNTWPNGLRVPVYLEAWHLVPTGLFIRDKQGDETPIESDTELNLHDVATGEKLILATMIRKFWDEHEPKEEGHFGWELSYREAEPEGTERTLCIGFEAKFLRTYRLGAMTFCGLVDQRDSQIHATRFRIEVEGAPIDPKKQAHVSTRKELGLLMKTTFVHTVGPEAKSRREQIYSGRLVMDFDAGGTMTFPIMEKLANSA